MLRYHSTKSSEIILKCHSAVWHENEKKLSVFFVLGAVFSTYPQTCSRSKIFVKVGNILKKKPNKQKLSHDPDNLKIK